MNVASKDLSAELYELMPEWNDTDYRWYQTRRAIHKSEWEDLGGADEYHALTIEQLPLYHWETKDAAARSQFVSPAYDLGYLLRKLPKDLGRPAHRLMVAWGHTVNQWFATYEHNMHLSQYDDTPENAACRLAIELFKQEILTEEHPHGN